MARGPAYPYIDLPKAVEMSEKMHSKAKRHAVSVNSVVKDAWDYSPTSSSGQKTFAALRYYGLVEDVTGGAQKEVKLTDRAVRILLGSPDSEERKKALRDAALSPAQYANCWKKWGNDLPDDSAIRDYLLFERNFVESTVGGFISDYKSTLKYAGLLEPGAADGDDSNGNGDEREKPSIAIGDYIQWESLGVWQFDAPKKVASMSANGAFLFVEGSGTGIPAEEAVLKDPPSNPPKPNPGINRDEAPGMQQATFPLNEGDAIIQWPKTLSADSYEEFEAWVQLTLKRAKRSVVEAPKDDADDLV